MSRFILHPFEGSSLCPRCKSLMKSHVDKVFGTSYFCANCLKSYFCTGPGINEHEVTVSDNYSEALIELSALDV